MLTGNDKNLFDIYVRLLQSYRKTHTDEGYSETEESERLYRECLKIQEKLERIESSDSSQKINELLHEFSRMLDQYDSAPINAHIIPHINIITLGNHLGYWLNKNGVCYGISATAINMFMHSREQFERFEEALSALARVYEIYRNIDVKYEHLKRKIKVAHQENMQEQLDALEQNKQAEIEKQTKILYALLTTNVTDPNDVCLKEDFLKTLAVLENIKITFDPSRFDVSILFPPESEFRTQSAGYEAAAALLEPKHNIARSNKLPQRVCHVERVHTRESLNESLQQITNVCAPPINGPLGMMIGNKHHVLSCIYEPDSKTWHIIDSDKLFIPSIATVSIKDVSEFIIKSLSDGGDDFIINMDIITSADQKNLLSDRLHATWLPNEQHQAIKQMQTSANVSHKDRLFNDAMRFGDDGYLNAVAAAFIHGRRQNHQIFSNEMLCDIFRSETASSIFIRNDVNFFKNNPIDCNKKITRLSTALQYVVALENKVATNALLDRQDIDINEAIRLISYVIERADNKNDPAWQLIMTKAKTIQASRVNDINFDTFSVSDHGDDDDNTSDNSSVILSENEHLTPDRSPPSKPNTLSKKPRGS